GGDVASLYLRAARILQQESPEDPRLLPMIFKTLDADPLNEQAGYLAETMLAGTGHLQHVQKLQDRRVGNVADARTKLTLLVQFGNIWQVRLNNPPMAAYFFRQALELSYTTADLHFPGHVAAYRA